VPRQLGCQYDKRTHTMDQQPLAANQQNQFAKERFGRQ
jgi:hypothetical protein